jgi:hypothetical protein
MTKPNESHQDAPGSAGRDRPRRQRSPAEEEAFQQAVKQPGFWESLTPEVRAEWEAFDWPQYLVGRPPEIRDIPRRPRRRGEPPREG